MSDLLELLWETYKDRLFSQNAIARDLSLDHAKQQTVIHQLNELKNQPAKNGLKIKSIGSGFFKIICAEPSEADPIKDLPLPSKKEGLTADSLLASPSGLNHRVSADNVIFSIFNKGLASGTADGSISLSRFLDRVRTDTSWQSQKERINAITDETKRKTAKNSLPAITVSCLITRENQKRAALIDGKFQHTGYIQADFDCPQEEADTLLEKLSQDPHVRIGFKSISNRSKAFFLVKMPQTIHEHDSAWNQLNDYCITQGYGELDPVPKNVNALCYISYDPDVWMKDAIPLPWELLPEPKPVPKAQPSARDTSDLKQLKSALDAIPADEYLSHWIEIGCALHHSDIPDETAFALWDAWSKRSPKYDQTPDQMHYKWNSFATEREKRHGIGYIYYLASQHGWQPPPREIKRRKKKRRYRGGY